MFFDGFVDPDHVKRERRKAQELRASQWWRQQIGRGECYHCGGRFPREQLTMDHLVPLARGGRTAKNNVVVACKTCNTEKGYKMSVEMTMERMRGEGSLSSEVGVDQAAPMDETENPRGGEK